jgi:hypothetical protein
MRSNSERLKFERMPPLKTANFANTHSAPLDSPSLFRSRIRGVRSHRNGGIRALAHESPRRTLRPLIHRLDWLSRIADATTEEDAFRAYALRLGYSHAAKSNASRLTDTQRMSQKRSTYDDETWVDRGLVSQEERGGTGA